MPRPSLSVAVPYGRHHHTMRPALILAATLAASVASNALATPTAGAFARLSKAAASSPLAGALRSPQTETERAPSTPRRLVWVGKDVDGDGAADFVNPTGQAPRTFDAYGSGAFGASRDGGSRPHEGVDYAAVAGQSVVAPMSGFVTKIGYAYGDAPDLRYVEITNPALGYTTRVFYLKPNVEVGQAVGLGKVIGQAESLQARYPGGMTDHVHLEIADQRGHKDATKFIVAQYEPVAAGALRF